MNSEEIELNPNIISIRNEETGYIFLEDLLKRKAELKLNMKRYNVGYKKPLPPVVVREKDMNLMDGYCRFTTLSDLSVPRVYAYLG